MTEASEFHSLYRRFRPQRFEEVLGQEHVTRALRNAVANSKVSHAYLFSGPRGTGKTSTARILAKALNCERPIGGEPCSECESCTLVREGRSYDVEELDAASNSGVDAIRDLISTVSIASYGTWKIYIVDEVHMLSTAASNALLKTLEEPPEHVVFVLATTSPQKVLQTIRSRTQHFEFKLLSEENLEQLLDYVSREASLGLGQKELAWARRKGKGSARDTLSYLDQVVALGELPTEDADHLSGLAVALLAGDGPSVVMSVEHLAREGLEPAQIAGGILELLREAFLFRVASLGDVGYPPILIEALKKAEVIYAASDLTRVMEGVGRATLDLREGIDPLTLLEALLLSVCVPKSEAHGQGAMRESKQGGDAHAQVQEDRLRLLEEEVRELKRTVDQFARGQSPTTRPAGSSRMQSPKGPSILDSVRRGMGGSRAAEVSEAVAPGLPDVMSPSERNLPGRDRTPQPGRSSDLESVPSIDTGTRQEVTLEVSESPAKTQPFANEAKREEDVRLEAPRADVRGSEGEDTQVSLPSREKVVMEWGNRIAESLPLATRTRFQTVRFLEVATDSVLLGFENQIYLQRANGYESAVGEALARHFGVQSVRVSMVVKPVERALESTSHTPAQEEELISDFMNSTATVEADSISEAVNKVFPGVTEVQ